MVEEVPHLVIPLMSRSGLEIVQGLLNRIESQDVRCFALVALSRQGTIHTAWSNECANDIFRMLGAIEHLKQDFYEMMIKERIEPVEPPAAS